MMFGNGKQKDMQARAEEIAAEAADSVRDLGRNARSTADDVKKEAVRLLNNAADTIRHEARERGASRDVRGGADDVAKSLERAAHYLKRHSFEDMGEDVTRSVQRNPWRIMAILFVLGVIVGLVLRGDNEKVEYRVIRNNYPGNR
jgi:ElaB/YqjD/DUF883 family membrane-anchored ribosome-binding protein